MRNGPALACKTVLMLRSPPLGGRLEARSPSIQTEAYAVIAACALSCPRFAASLLIAAT